MTRRVAQGVKMGPPAKSAELMERVRRLKGEGKSKYAISKELGMSASTVAKYII
jgi:predicted transcriptional regulator